MKITNEDLTKLIQKIISESYTELYPEGWKDLDGIMMNPEGIERMKQWVKDNPVDGIIDEGTTYELNSDDPKMQQKVDKISKDTTLFNKEEDEIKIINDDDTVVEGKTNRKIGTKDDYLKAVKKTDRELDYEMNGPGWKAKDRAHKNKKKYNRKDYQNFDDINEEYTKSDILKIMLEKKYNGTVYSKSDFENLIKG